MRVALVVTDLKPGGTPLRIVRLARRLRAAGIEVHVGCLAPPGPLSDELSRDGIPTFAGGAVHSRDFRAIFRLRDQIRQIHPDLIHSTLTHANVACRWIGRNLHIPVVTATTTIEVERPWHIRLERWTHNWDRGHIVNSNAVAEHVHQKFGVPRARIFLVPPSVEPWPVRLDQAECRKKLNLPLDRRVILWAGRFDPVKRVDRLIDCIASDELSDCVLALAGDGPLRAAIEAQIAEKGVGDRVHLLGWQANLTIAMSAADVFAFPSLTEGMPNAVLSAMAIGLPVVASDIPVHRELAGPEKRIWLVKHSVTSWVAALRDRMSYPSHGQQLAQSAAAWAKAHLTPEGTVGAVLAIYDEILKD